MGIRDIRGPGVTLKLGEDPRTILGLRSSSDGTNVCASGRQLILLRTPDEINDPVILSEAIYENSGSNGEALGFQDRAGTSRTHLRIAPAGQGIGFHAKFQAAKHLWLVEWKLAGLDLDAVIIPALGGQVISRDMPAGTTLSFKYPFWWNAQFVIGQSAGKGGLLIRTMEVEPRLKLLRVSREDDRFTISIGFEAPAPLTSSTLEAEWYLEWFEGDWRVAVDRHRAWMEQAFQLEPLAKKTYCPEWARQINFILEIWGARKGSEQPPHTFEQMIERIKTWQGLHSPGRTLLYLPGFAEHGIDSHAPDYRPSEELGGARKFKTLVDTAHDLGYRVMVHTNVLAMTFSHPLYPKFEQYQVIDAFNRQQTWGLDMDGDWLTEPYFAYINPGSMAWGELMEEVLGGLITDYGVDAVFLDQTLLAFNVSRGPNFIVGMRSHIERLQTAFPNILFAGEGIHEHVVSALPMAQIHGIDSLSDIHGMEGSVPWRRAHPVSTYLFDPYTRFMAHLLTKHPSHPIFAFQEQSYRELGVLPALCLYDNDQLMDPPGVKEMIARAETMNL